MANFSYKEQLENQLWLNKRAEILQRDGFRCRYCGETKCLQVHHKQYIEGRLAWEYDNSDLITLCKSCHAREHNGGSNEKILISKRKVVMFRSLLMNRDFTHCEKIVYSHLAALSMLEGQKFDNDWFSLKMGSFRKTAKHLAITPQTLMVSKKSLIAKGIIKGDKIYIPNSLYGKGYFELFNRDKLSGAILIFYSYIKDRAKLYGGSIDTYKSRLAQIFGVKIYSISQYLTKLYSLNLIKRLDDGKLLIM
jgi:hypothetical protein